MDRRTIILQLKKKCLSKNFLILLFLRPLPPFPHLSAPPLFPPPSFNYLSYTYTAGGMSTVMSKTQPTVLPVCTFTPNFSGQSNISTYRCRLPLLLVRVPFKKTWLTESNHDSCQTGYAVRYLYNTTQHNTHSLNLFKENFLFQNRNGGVESTIFIAS